MVVDESGTTPCMDTFMTTMTDLTNDYNYKINTGCLWVGLGGVIFGAGTVTYLVCVAEAETNFNNKGHF